MREDWISPWWQAALLPYKWDVCGVAVPSLSVWHTFALENIGNRYLCGGPCDRDDAAGLLMFAQHDMAGGRRLMQPNAINYRKRQASRIYKRLKKAEWSEVHAACLEYVETCTRAVSRWNKQDQTSKPAGVPYQWHLVKCMCFGNVNEKSLADAWNMPYPVARCIYDAYAESKGDDSLMANQYQEMEDNWSDYKDDKTEMKLEIA